ncbi:DoxX family protein [Salinibacterium sp. UTAS2018]|uniref:DoxX family protein n=1 Tax=Salinibacterium sp. UTAS2018 TaxID=2508880 RepID=UPI0010096FF8|nr:DoxX family protein [Salinibacterium sp. UTAS2018]QAV71280.1 DoxX family protein [Salinibacterium sp. UTAS2018]
MMNRALSLVASVITGAARVGLGILWLNEGLFKIKAGFDGADIGLVVDSTASNNRVADGFEAFTATFLGGAPGFFGWAIPALEVGLGIALILGVLTFPAALMSAATLLSYWSADQLIEEYPIMLALSVVTVAFVVSASRISVTTIVEKLVKRKKPETRWFSAQVRRWL